MSSTVVIDRDVMRRAALALGQTEAQLMDWFRVNYDTIRAVRLYIQTHGTTEPGYIELYADPTGARIDPTLVTQILALLAIGGLVVTLET